MGTRLQSKLDELDQTVNWYRLQYRADRRGCGPNESFVKGTPNRAAHCRRIAGGGRGSGLGTGAKVAGGLLGAGALGAGALALADPQNRAALGRTGRRLQKQGRVALGRTAQAGQKAGDLARLAAQDPGGVANVLGAREAQQAASNVGASLSRGAESLRRGALSALPTGVAREINRGRRTEGQNRRFTKRGQTAQRTLSSSGPGGILPRVDPDANEFERGRLQSVGPTQRAQRQGTASRARRTATSQPAGPTDTRRPVGQGGGGALARARGLVSGITGGRKKKRR